MLIGKAMKNFCWARRHDGLVHRAVAVVVRSYCGRE